MPNLSAVLPMLLTYSVDSIEAATASGIDGVVGQFQNLALHSHFQPIISLAHRRVVGYEGLVRPRSADGQALAPGVLFDKVESDDDIVFLDRLARNLHVRNLVGAGEDETWLFLNVNARVAMRGKEYGPYFEAMLARHGLAPHRVVIELIENEIQDEAMLAEAMRYYRELGCLVAIDDFGAGQSNFERIWRVQPQLVKIDRSALIQAREHTRVRRVLPSLIALLHETGCLTLMEGIENEEEAMIALDAGVDFAQGFYFGRPAPLPQTFECVPLLDRLCARYAESAHTHIEQNRGTLDGYIAPFREAAGLVALGMDAAKVSQSLLQLPRVLRCYVLDGRGRQLGENVVSPVHGAPIDRRFQPLMNAGDANWGRRPYFQRAMANPEQIQISRPYLSVTDAKMCCTMSICVKDAAGADRVYCVDILDE